MRRHHNLTAGAPISGPLSRGRIGRRHGLALGGGGSSDPDFANVVLLMGFEGADGSTTFSDESGFSNGPWTGDGGASITTDQAKFGDSCLDLTTLNAALKRSPDADFHIPASTPFCAEAFIRLTALTSRDPFFCHQWRGDNPSGWALLYDGVSGQLQFRGYPDAGGGLLTVGGSWTPSLDTWHHVVVERDDAGLIRALADGAVIATSAVNTDGFSKGTYDDAIGETGTGSDAVSGYIDELRITIGAHRYGGAYAVPTAAFPRS